MSYVIMPLLYVVYVDVMSLVLTCPYDHDCFEMTKRYVRKVARPKRLSSYSKQNEALSIVFYLLTNINTSTHHKHEHIYCSHTKYPGQPACSISWRK